MLSTRLEYKPLFNKAKYRSKTRTYDVITNIERRSDENS